MAIRGRAIRPKRHEPAVEPLFITGDPSYCWATNTGAGLLRESAPHDVTVTLCGHYCTTALLRNGRGACCEIAGGLTAQRATGCAMAPRPLTERSLSVYGFIPELCRDWIG